MELDQTKSFAVIIETSGIYKASGTYCGQVLPDTETMHGYGTWSGDDGRAYAGEWSHGLFDGRGAYDWPDGGRYEGEYRKGNRHGRGIQWLPGRGRCFEGTWAYDFPMRGTAFDPSGELSLAVFNGSSGVIRSWYKATRTPVGRLADGRAPKGGNGGPAVWTTTVQLEDGSRYEGSARGLSPYGAGLLFRPKGPPQGLRIMSDGRKSFAEGPAWEVCARVCAR
jgi:hypothetical protein